ncbi:hypothetical protein I6A81_20100 [Frankia sp. CN7]|uniref:hypothetical protein n=1 Tax=Frankia nepalensis TaxID=1836974 RepID=UPI00193251C0|nr:hypothetical protein [Frankia nepalensis]MBL7498503.1 hypothetical protein [Frankia nepalensis]MBL7509644.1 hypothetical protein [Frankia nepalensis]
MSQLKEMSAAGLLAASQDRPFCVSATIFVRSAAVNCRSLVGPSTRTRPTATLPSR